MMPRSMCSLMPKPKLPESEKLRRMSSYSFTFRPASCRGAERRGARAGERDGAARETSRYPPATGYLSRATEAVEGGV